MDLHLTHKLALITGSTKGIGKAIATELAREGADVIINGRNQDEVDRIVADIKTQFPSLTRKVQLLILPMKLIEHTSLSSIPRLIS